MLLKENFKLILSNKKSEVNEDKVVKNVKLKQHNQGWPDKSKKAKLNPDSSNLKHIKIEVPRIILNITSSLKSIVYIFLTPK